MPRQLPANTLATREEFFGREQEAWTAFVHAWADLSDADLLRPGACGELWGVKDVLNHIAAWQEAARRMIEGIRAGRWARLGMNTAKFNQHQYDRDRDRPLRESRDRLFEARSQLLHALEPLSAEQLLNEYGRQQCGWWAKWNTYAHYEPHTIDLAAFRQRLGLDDPASP